MLPENVSTGHGRGRPCFGGAKEPNGIKLRPALAEAGRIFGFETDGVERAVRLDGVVCLDSGRQKSQTGSNFDRAPAAPVDFWGVGFDGVKRGVGFDGVVCLDSGAKEPEVYMYIYIYIYVYIYIYTVHDDIYCTVCIIYIYIYIYVYT
jgi:hypothetical protein